MAESSAQEWIDYLDAGGRYEAAYAPETRQKVLAASKRIMLVSAILAGIGLAGILVASFALPRGWGFLCIIFGILVIVCAVILIMGWRISRAFELSTRPETDGAPRLALAVTSAGLEFSREVAVPWSAVASIDCVDSSAARAAAFTAGNWKQRLGARLGGGAAAAMGSPAEFVIVALHDGPTFRESIADPLLQQRVRVWPGSRVPMLGDLMVPLDPAVPAEQRAGLRYIVSAMAAERGVPIAHHESVAPVLMGLAARAVGPAGAVPDVAIEPVSVAVSELAGAVTGAVPDAEPGVDLGTAPAVEPRSDATPMPVATLQAEVPPASAAELSLADLVDDAIFFSAEVQAAIDERWGHRPWRVDFSAQRFSFEGGPTATFGLQLVGSTAQGAGTWLWGWNNVNGFPEGLVSVAQHVKSAGDQWGIPELATPELRLSEGLPLRLTLAAQALSGQYGHMDLDLGRGTRAWVLLSGPALALEPPTMLRSLRILGEGLSATSVTDHRRALISYARLRGLALGWYSPESALLHFPDGDIRVGFDQHGRVSGLATQ